MMLRRAIGGEIRRLIASPGQKPALRLAGEAGLFPPASVARAVHGDLVTMLVGGVGALMLQMLHPHALAGVWDHSDFRRDMAGRLRRTAAFISLTTFGSTAQAEAQIARIRAIHDRVHGVAPDGRPYSANDPGLLTWVHVSGAWCFLQAYLRYGAPLTGAQQDGFYRDAAVVARRLGADEVPVSRRQVQDYFDAVRPALGADHRTRIVADALRSETSASIFVEPARRILFQAGVGLLPQWAARLHGLSDARTPATTDMGVRSLRHVVRWALAPAG